MERSGADDASAVLATHEALADAHARILAAMASMPRRRPWMDEDRRLLRERLRRVLAIREEWIPTVTVRSCRDERREGLAVRRLCAQTWEGVAAAGVLWRTDESDRPRPLVLLCCGHGPGGKLHVTYQRMAIHLARSGAAVLVIDNIGQGEREPMGHRRPWGVFARGLTVQGLITMEATGWLRWAARQPWTDPRRIAAIGNSGGGATTLTLATLDEGDLACVVSSGHPSSQAYTCRKERALCACALWPGVAGTLEMWELLACFAPRPLLIFQGLEDHLFPADHFHRLARQVATAYRLHAEHARLGVNGESPSFRAELLPGGHPWDDPRILLVGEFLAAALGLTPPSAAPPHDDPALLAPTDTCYPAWDPEAADAEAIARALAGPNGEGAMTGPVELWDLYPPDLPLDRIAQITPSADTRHILAQLAAFTAAPRPCPGYEEPVSP